MSEVIQLRKNFIEDNPFYLDEVYGQDNDNGTRNRNNEGGEDITQSFGGYESYEAISPQAPQSFPLLLPANPRYYQ